MGGVMGLDGGLGRGGLEYIVGSESDYAGGRVKPFLSVYLSKVAMLKSTS